MSFVHLGRAANKTISCERIGNGDNWVRVGRARTCTMKVTTTIESEEFVITPADSSVIALSFADSKKIKCLPINVDDTFINLAGYFASDSSLKAVSKINFQNLTKLRYLGLHNNEIEKIDGDTFEDLTSLEEIRLRKCSLLIIFLIRYLRTLSLQTRR